MTLNIDDKRKSILACEKNLLVIGGPGCGKTTIALAKAFEYIKNKKLNRGQRILFLSFSRNAKARILESASSFNEHKELGKKLYVQTFHAFFLEIIKTHGYLLGTPKKITIIPPHDEDALRGIRDKDSKDWLAQKNNLFMNEGKITFDKFSETVLKIISRSSRIKKTLSYTFPLIIVDEAQDTDLDQWKIVQAFDGISQLLLLGDLDQQIFDYRHDINPERLNDIKQSIKPVEITLESQNYRNPNTEILRFAKDILNNTPRQNGYNGVTLLLYNPRAERRDIGIRKSIGILNKKIRDITGKHPKNIALLTPWSRGVKMISAALRAGGIPHRVQFDETATNLSSRLIACLMEPILDRKQHLMFVLYIFRDFYSAKGSRGDLKKYEGWIEKIRIGKTPAGKIIPFFIELIKELQQHEFSGNPAIDWKHVQQKLLTCEMKPIKSFVAHSEFLIAYNRGRIIMRDLVNVWIEFACYADARSILQRAIIEAQLSSDVVTEEGINVMTTYKSKGKEFDGVIIFQNQHVSPLELRGDNQSLDRSRKLFLVGVTRARHHVFILKQAGLDSPLLDDFNLNRLGG